MRKEVEKRKFVVYKVKNEKLHCYSDPESVEVKRNLEFGEAVALVNKLQKTDASIPLNERGDKQRLYKYVSEQEWKENQLQLIN